MSVTVKLKELLTPDGEASALPPAPTTVGSLVDALGAQSFGMVLILFALPSALPVPAPGYSTPFAIILSLLALQLIMGRPVLWLPGWLRRRKVPRESLQRAVLRLENTLGRWAERRERWRSRSRLVRGTERLSERWLGFPARFWISLSGRRLVGFLILFLALVMGVPIPLTNTLPAMVILLLGFGLSEERGTLLSLGMLLALVVCTLYGGLLYGVIAYGPEFAESVKNFFRELFTSS